MKIIIMLLISISIVFTQTINEQIKSLESVSPEERVAVMNQIKEQLIEMNQNERMNTIEKLRAKMNPRPEQEIKAHPGNAEGLAKEGVRPPKKFIEGREFIKDRVEHSSQEFERPKDNHESVRGEGKHPQNHGRDIGNNR